MTHFQVLTAKNNIVNIEADTLGTEGEDVFVFYKNTALGKKELAQYHKDELQDIALPGYTFWNIKGRYVALLTQVFTAQGE